MVQTVSPQQSPTRPEIPDLYGRLTVAIGPILTVLLESGFAALFLWESERRDRLKHAVIPNALDIRRAVMALDWAACIEAREAQVTGYFAVGGYVFYQYPDPIDETRWSYCAEPCGHPVELLDIPAGMLPSDWIYELTGEDVWETPVDPVLRYPDGSVIDVDEEVIPF